jgi:hypothetical protein
VTCTIVPAEGSSLIRFESKPSVVMTLIDFGPTVVTSSESYAYSNASSSEVTTPTAKVPKKASWSDSRFAFFLQIPAGPAADAGEMPHGGPVQDGDQHPADDQDHPLRAMLGDQERSRRRARNEERMNP